MNIFSKVPFFFFFSATSVCDSGDWKSMMFVPGVPKSDEAAVTMGSRRSSVCSSYSPF